MLKKIRGFVLVCVILCSILYAHPALYGLAKLDKKQEFAHATNHRVDNLGSQGTFAFENCVKDVFNAKKNVVVRVVCVAKSDCANKDDQTVKQILAGTGFFISDKANVLTTASIVKNAHKIWVDYGGASYAAECIGVDSITNVAVLKLLQPPTKFDIVDISSSDQQHLAEIGSFVVFVGCKLGMDPLPELGNITGKNIAYSDNEFLTTYLRTNLMFCGGESGAPVFDVNGNLVGMMIASLPEMLSSFVLPKRALTRVVEEIVKNGFIKYGKIGIEVKTEFVFGEGQRIVIAKVLPGSEAEKCGLGVGDIVRTVDQNSIKYKEDFFNAIFFCVQKEKIDIAVVRDGNDLSFSVKLEYFTD